MARWDLALLVLAIPGLVGCKDKPAAQAQSQTNQVTLSFVLELNPQTYQDSAWGDPPQWAIWLFNPTTKQVKTVAVTHRTGTGDWEGKPNCPVSLPYWTRYYNLETNTQGPPSWKHPAPETMTCATPRQSIQRKIIVPANSSWDYYLEINCSGDFSVDFPQLSDEGINDDYGNGEPSLVYWGQINVEDGHASDPNLMGHTDQYHAQKALDKHCGDIVWATGLVADFKVVCQSKETP